MSIQEDRGPSTQPGDPPVLRCWEEGGTRKGEGGETTHDGGGKREQWEPGNQGEKTWRGLGVTYNTKRCQRSRATGAGSHGEPVKGAGKVGLTGALAQSRFAGAFRTNI